MFFTINFDKTLTTEDYSKLRIVANAKLRLSTYQYTKAEINLDAYMKKQYNKTLKQVCLDIIADIKIQKSAENNFIVLFRHQSNDLLASLITYGNSEVDGSQILQQAFSYN